MQEVTPIRSEALGVNTAPRASRRRRFRIPPAWFFMAPSLLILGVFVLWPILESLWYSLHNWVIGSDVQPWVGLDNYVALTRDPLVWGALVHTVEITVVSVIILVALGLLMALALSSEGIGSRIIRSAFLFPGVLSLTAIGLAFRFLADPNIGLFSGLLKGAGIQPIPLLSSTTLALPTIIAVWIWTNVGFAMIVLVAGFKGIPAELYEAARIDGAGSFALTRYVTVPSLRPTLLFVTLILTIRSLQTFDLVYVMTAGGPLFTTDTLVTTLIREGFVNFHTGYASALSGVLLVFIAAVTSVQLRFFRYNDAD